MSNKMYSLIARHFIERYNTHHIKTISLSIFSLYHIPRGELHFAALFSSMKPRLTGVFLDVISDELCILACVR